MTQKVEKSAGWGSLLTDIVKQKATKPKAVVESEFS